MILYLQTTTQQEREDDDNISLAGEAPPIMTIDTTNASDQNKTEIARPGPIYKLSTDFDRKVKAVNKIKKKYLRKKSDKGTHKIKFLQNG